MSRKADLGGKGGGHYQDSFVKLYIQLIKDILRMSEKKSGNFKNS